jgi:protein-S-isoprenylcysteine O-methyltransferase Ste14
MAALQQSPVNPMRKWVLISQVILVVSVLLVVVALVTGMLARGATYSSREAAPLVLTATLTGVFGGVGLLVGIILFFSFRKQAAEIDEMIREAGHPDAMVAGENLLAHWTYSPQEWSQYVQSEITRGKTGRTIVLLVMLVALAIPVILFLSSASRSRGPVLVPLIIPIITFVGIGLFVWWLATANVRRMKKQSAGEAFIAGTGLLFNDRYYPWNVIGTGLTGVSYEPGNPNVVRFKYLKPGAQGTTHEESVRVPVPIGHEEEAQSLVARLPR